MPSAIDNPARSAAGAAPRTPRDVRNEGCFVLLLDGNRQDARNTKWPIRGMPMITMIARVIAHNQDVSVPPAAPPLLISATTSKNGTTAISWASKIANLFAPRCMQLVPLLEKLNDNGSR